MTWEDVLKRDDIVGGDIESHEDGYVYRGPISSFRLESGMIRFESPWCARMPEDMSAGWKPWDITSSFVSASITPNDIGDGRVQFMMPGLGFAVIFPKGGSKLDPAKVEGLRL
ncbi:hypothetical protein HY635_03205 [Candidatus Uhrbacteria bacterium]|nr:hypothetical protein [Candidatus Uhrbacteria bacterium]